MWIKYTAHRLYSVRLNKAEQSQIAKPDVEITLKSINKIIYGVSTVTVLVSEYQQETRYCDLYSVFPVQAPV